MAQILPSSTCKASVGERETERERERQIRGSGLQEFLQKNEKSGARASGGAGASCECRAGGNVSWGAKDSSNFYFWRK